MGIQPPEDSGSELLDEVVTRSQKWGKGLITRALIFSPDAIGTSLVRGHGSLFAPLDKYVPIRIGLRSVVPPKTPVCYASMFTGAVPGVHGITRYVKQAPRSETIFDVAAREGKKVAIVAVKDSSLDLIFRQSSVEQFSEVYDQAVTNRTMDLIEVDRYDLIVVYQQEYDDTLHRQHPESQEALEAVGRHVESFTKIAQTVGSKWSRHRYMIAFSPDHGAHFDSAIGTGTHGDDVPEDMEVTHFFGLG
jgi:hypothetical protein